MRGTRENNTWNSKKEMRIYLIQQGKIVFLLLVCVLSLGVGGCASLSSSQSSMLQQEMLRLEKMLIETNQRLIDLNNQVLALNQLLEQRKKPDVVQPTQKQTSATKIQEREEYLLTSNQPVTDPVEKIYVDAQNALKKQEYSSAITLFTTIYNQNPKHDLADNALYWKGEALYAEKKYSEALSTFKQVIEHYPERNKVPDAMLKIAFSYLSLNDPENAHKYLKELLIKYPFTMSSEKAENLIKKIEE
ncbi:MAG: tol-pal system protein YbgF [Desulfobacterales bacterium]|nr:tol-pal system protein YbgF [Desulfobacterales bacterium]